MPKTRAATEETTCQHPAACPLYPEFANLPAGRVVENARVEVLEARESCRMDLGSAKSGASEKKESRANQQAGHAR